MRLLFLYMLYVLPIDVNYPENHNLSIGILCVSSNINSYSANGWFGYLSFQRVGRAPNGLYFFFNLDRYVSEFYSIFVNCFRHVDRFSKCHLFNQPLSLVIPNASLYENLFLFVFLQNTG